MPLENHETFQYQAYPDTSPPPYPGEPRLYHNSEIHTNRPAPSDIPEANPFRPRITSEKPPRPTSRLGIGPGSQYQPSSSGRSRYNQQDLAPPSTSLTPYESSSSSSSSQPPSDDAILSQALVFTQHAGRLPSQPSPLPRPIAIPQTKSGTGEAFLRAWAPNIQSKNIKKSEFIAFIDNLNVVSTASPPLQVVDLAGGVIGMIPYHWAALAGGLVQATAKIGTAAVSKGRTELYMKEVNKQLFNPRGLKVSIASSLATREILRVPPSVPKLAPLNNDTFYLSTAERAFQAVALYCARLDLDVPPPTEQTTLLARLSARQVESKDKKNHKKLLKEREKAVEKEGKRERKEARKEDKRERKEVKREEKRAKKDRKKGKKIGSSDSDSSDDEAGVQRGSMSRKETKGNEDKKDKEEKQAGKLLWIVVENL